MSQPRKETSRFREKIGPQGLTRVGLLVLLFLAVLAVRCKREPLVWTATRPSVILISLDTVRADHLSCYGYHRPTTPGLDQLAREGALFTRTFTTMPTTLPAHASLFTSLHPREHMVLNNSWPLSSKFPLLTEALKRMGYNTAAVAGSAILEKGMGLERGFDFYDDNFDQYSEHGEDKSSRKKDYRRTARQVVKAGIAWLKGQDPAQPVFLFLHFFDAHSFYGLTPQPYQKMFPGDAELATIMKARNQNSKHRMGINKYDGSIRFIDDSLQELWSFLKAVNLYDHSLIIIVADHGEGLGEHNWYDHGLRIYEEQMRVPLIIRFPGKEHAGRQLPALVNLMDVAPTVLDFLGPAAPPSWRGRSLLGLLQAPAAFPAGLMFYERCWYPEKQNRVRDWESGERFGVRDERYKYLWHSQFPPELYDLLQDPHELANIINDQPAIAASLHQELVRYWELVQKGPVTPPPVDPKRMKQLKSLGYLQ